MTKVPSLDHPKIISALRRDGWVVVRQRGNHIRLQKHLADETLKLTVPAHRPVKRSTLAHILKDRAREQHRAGRTRSRPADALPAATQYVPFPGACTGRLRRPGAGLDAHDPWEDRACLCVAPVRLPVTFEPVQTKVWQDTRPYANSPWSPPFEIPPVPPDGKWEVQATFDEPGTYLLRALASDGALFTAEDMTVTVTP